MPILSQFYRAQDFADLQVVPMLFYPLNASAMTDGTQPGVFQPFRSDEDGNLLVAIGGAGGGPILLPDNVDDVASVATNSRVPVVARLYGLERASNEWDRLLTDDDDAENSFANEDNALLRVMTRGRLYDNTSDAWAREKANGTEAVATSAARTVTTAFSTALNINWRAWHVIVDVTVIGADTLEINIEARDVVTLAWYPLLIGLPISTTGTTVFKIGQGFTPQPNLTANNMIPHITRINAVHSGPAAITYSIASNYGV